MNKKLRYAAIAGIFFIIISIFRMMLRFIFPFFPVEVIEASQSLINIPLTVFTNFLSTLLSIPSLLLLIVFLWGFKVVGDRTHNTLLKITSYLLMIVSIISLAFSLLFLPVMLQGHSISGLFSVFLMGVTAFEVFFRMVFGVGLLRLRKHFGLLATVAGVLEISTLFYIIWLFLALIRPDLQFFLVVVILPSYFARFVALMLEIVLLFRASEKF